MSYDVGISRVSDVLDSKCSYEGHFLSSRRFPFVSFIAWNSSSSIFQKPSDGRKLFEMKNITPMITAINVKGLLFYF